MTKRDLLMITTLDTPKAERELEDLLPKLDAAGICSAKNGGKGWDITLTDFQINVLRELVKEVLHDDNT